MTQKEADHKIAIAKTKSTVILLEALAEDFERRKQDGSLLRDLKGSKLTSAINSLTKMLAAIKQTGVVVVQPPQSAPQHDPSFYRAHSAVNMTDKEREALRAKAVDATVVPEQENP